MANRCYWEKTSYKAMLGIYASTDGLYVRMWNEMTCMIVCNHNRGEECWWVMMIDDGERGGRTC